jgi:hypothetical protein
MSRPHTNPSSVDLRTLHARLTRVLGIERMAKLEHLRAQVS